MEPRIHDDDFCVFRASPTGTRQGEIVLAQYRGPADPETGGSFTIKCYSSEKVLDLDGGWRHNRVTSSPLNPEHKPIVLTPSLRGTCKSSPSFLQYSDNPEIRSSGATQNPLPAAEAEEIVMAKRVLQNVPWITADGFLDMTKIPLEGNFKTALDPNRDKARDSLRFLQSAANYGRTEASVFLMGLLVSLPPDDWEMRSAAVEALRYTHTERCAALLFSEIRRVKSTNTTRRYIDTILDVLRLFPEDLTRGEFEALAADTAFSYKMRRKFRALTDPECGLFPW